MEKILLERLSLRAICRVLAVSMGWLTHRLKALWQAQGYDLPIGSLPQAEVKLVAVEANEFWSFVGNKTVQQWIWLAIERRSGLVVGFYIGDCSAASAQCLWWSIAAAVRAKALFFTDDWDVYGAVIPSGHHTMDKADIPSSSDLTTPCASGVVGWFAKRCRFPKVWRIATKRSCSFYATTTLRFWQEARPYN